MVLECPSPLRATPAGLMQPTRCKTRSGRWRPRSRQRSPTDSAPPKQMLTGSHPELPRAPVLARPTCRDLQGGRSDAALITVRPSTGEILSFQGSLDYYDSSIEGQVNVLTSERQPVYRSNPSSIHSRLRRDTAAAHLLTTIRRAGPILRLTIAARPTLTISFTG